MCSWEGHIMVARLVVNKMCHALVTSENAYDLLPHKELRAVI